MVSSQPAMKHLLRIRIFLKPYTRQILVSLLMLLTTTGLGLVVPRIIRSVIDDGIVRGETGYLIRSALLLLGLGLGSAILNLGNRYLSEWIASRVGYDLRNKIYDHIQQLPFTYHDHVQSGQLISRCIEDVRSIERFAGSSVTDLIRFVILTVGVLWIMVADNPRLAVIALLPIIPLALMTSSFGTKIGKLFFAVDQAIGDVSNRLQENVVGVQVVRAFARESYEIDRFDEANKKVFTTWVRVIDEWSKYHADDKLADRNQHHPHPLVWRTNGHGWHIDYRRHCCIQRLRFDDGGTCPAIDRTRQCRRRSRGGRTTRTRSVGYTSRNPLAEKRD